MRSAFHSDQKGKGMLMGFSKRWRLEWIQGLYYIGTGVWPIVSMRTFEMISGRKVDRWLVKAVGALIAVVGAVLIQGSAASSGDEKNNGSGSRTPRIRLPKQQAGREGASASELVRTLGLGAALCLAAVDLRYVYKRRISPVYLLDAIPELLFTVLWMRRRYP